jgi:hypothetical protein
MLHFEKDQISGGSNCDDCQKPIKVGSGVSQGGIFASHHDTDGQTYCAAGGSGTGYSSKQSVTDVTINTDPAVMAHLIIKYPKTANTLDNHRQLKRIAENIASHYSRYFDLSQGDMVNLSYYAEDDTKNYTRLMTNIVCSSVTCLSQLR